MIVGKLKDLKRYKGIHPNIDEAIDYVLNNDLLALPKGKTIVSENVFINRDTYVANPMEKCFFENHEKHTSGLRDSRVRSIFFTKLSEELLNIHRLYVR